MATATVFDVVRHILHKQGDMSAMKLQKLVYYCQAWSLVWDDDVLFDERIEAWANGPVVPSLYNAHRGQFRVSEGDFQNSPTSDGLSASQRETIDAVLEAYGDKSAQWLSDQTHFESPWREARTGLPENERSSAEISLVSMAEYYGSLTDG